MGCRLRDLSRALQHWSIVVTKTGGPHPWKAIGISRVDGTSQKFGIPAHKGMKSELRGIYIRACCRKFGIDEALVRGLMGCGAEKLTEAEVLLIEQQRQRASEMG